MLLPTLWAYKPFASTCGDCVVCVELRSTAVEGWDLADNASRSGTSSHHLLVGDLGEVSGLPLVSVR